MRLQNLIIIFVVIALPVILILQVFVNYQVDTASLKASYDNKFLGATYDMLTAFQLNTTNNKYSTVSDSLVRDIEASINTFSSSFGNLIGMTGTSKNTVMTYVPALLFTLYDGYYIYTPTTNLTELNNNSYDISYEHNLKPYVYYTKEYDYGANNKLVINFSLDNYVVVYNYKGSEYTSKAGYLEVIANSKTGQGVYYNEATGEVYYNGVEIVKDEILMRHTYGVASETESTSQSAYNYYKNAWEFTDWYNKTIRTAFNGRVEYNRLYININNQALPNVGSSFNDEKTEVIETSITDNLIQAMEMYKKKTGIDFQMPKLSALDWERILGSVCVVSFIQGFPVRNINLQ